MSSHLKDYCQHCYPAEVADVVVDFPCDKPKCLAVRLLMPDQVQAFFIFLDLLDTLAQFAGQQIDASVHDRALPV